MLRSPPWRGLNANMVFIWRRDPRFGKGRSAFLPVRVVGTEVTVPPVSVRVDDTGQIEIALASGHRLTLDGGFDVEVVLRLAKGVAAP